MSLVFIFLFAITFNAQADETEKNKTEGYLNSSDLKIVEIAQTEIEQKMSAGNVPTGDVNPEELQEAVDFASSKTGVRKDFLMGMLVVESNLGQNTGQCTYHEIETDAKNAHRNGRLSSRAWSTFNERKRLIKEIADGLNYDHEELKVSCNPAGYAGTGGALGIPQFMPDTWFEYKDRIASIVNKENPDPWDVKDGVVAMALKLSDVPGVTDQLLYAEKNAAKMYLSGNTSARYNWYANQVVYWSRNYRALLG